jgi:hypothetical protein
MYIHRNFTHPGGVSPMKQEKVEEKKVEEKKDKKKAFDYSKKQDYSGGPSESVQGVMDFITPQNKLELGLSAVGGFGTGMGRIGTKLLRTKVGQKVANKIPWLKNLTKPITKTAKGAKGTNTTKGGFDFSKKNDYSGGGKPKGGVDGGGKNIINGNEYYKGATHRGTVTDIKQFDNTIADATSTVSRQGKATDKALSEMNFKVATDLKPEHVKKVGTQSGRDIFEVSYPDGTTQKFWQSSGGGNKKVMYKGEEVSSEGFFGTVAGHMDNKIPKKQAVKRADDQFDRLNWDENTDPKIIQQHASMIDALTNNDGYFIKSSGWQGYGSGTYEQTGAALKEMFEKGLIK